MSNEMSKSNTGALARDPEQRDDLIQVLQQSLYAGAKQESVAMVLDYCAAANLDPMKKPVHIVPMNTKDPQSGQWGFRDVVMPGIGLYRIQADRSGTMAGISEPEFGPEITETFQDKNGNGVTVTFPEWCRVSAQKLVGNRVVEFVAKEYWLENYATDSSKSTAPNAMWKKRPRGQIAKCFDPETEVLTADGFQRFDSVSSPILQVTERGLEPCSAEAFSQKYDGEMIYAGGTRLNFMVTPNHDMLTADRKMEAGDMYDQATMIGSKIQIPRTVSGVGEDADVYDSVLRLIGYYMADGSHTGYHQFRIAVSRAHKIESLREVSLHEHESPKKDAGRVADSGDRAIATQIDKTCFTYQWSLVDEYVNPDKSVKAEKILGLSSRQARVIADAILEFDGSDNGAGVRRVIQTNQHVIAAFELIAVHGGYSISKPAERQSDLGASYSITVSDAAYFPVVKNVAKNSASLAKAPNESGEVWCVTVPSGVIVVRRHGFSMLCGNCTEAQALRKGWPEIGAGPTAEEMEGKDIEQPPRDVTPRQTESRATEPEELPEYPQERFKENLPKWQDAIESGKRSAEDIIRMVGSSYQLTDEQKKAIRKSEPVAEQEDSE